MNTDIKHIKQTSINEDSIKLILRERFEVVDEDAFNKYFELITNRAPESVYSEAHHILPKSLFPEYKSFKKHPWNLGRLTYKDHILAHYYFAKATDTLWKAVQLMLRHRQKTICGLTELEIMVLIDAVNKSHSIAWKHYDKLYQLWLLTPCSAKKFNKLATKHGYPDCYYGGIIKRFKENSDIKLKLGAPKTNKLWDHYDELYLLWKDQPIGGTAFRDRIVKLQQYVKYKSMSDTSFYSLTDSFKLKYKSETGKEAKITHVRQKRGNKLTSYHDELYKLWLTVRCGCVSFRKLAVKHGYPDCTAYEALVKQFCKDSGLPLAKRSKTPDIVDQLYVVWSGKPMGNTKFAKLITSLSLPKHSNLHGLIKDVFIPRYKEETGITVSFTKHENRTSPVWQYYDELYELWKFTGYGHQKLRQLAVERGYPDCRYEAILRDFQRQ